jgi:uncharacterized membrane protein
LAITRGLIGWNAGAISYLVLSIAMMTNATHASMQKRAASQGDRQITILLFVVLAAVASLVAIVVELASVKTLSANDKAAHIALAIVTIAASWAFTHMMFAIHYAHDFYVQRAKGLNPGLEFPKTENPEYADFCYFAFVIGTSAQTADVVFTSSAMRRIGLLHCLLAFLFNTTLLALMINIAASLF